MNKIMFILSANPLYTHNVFKQIIIIANTVTSKIKKNIFFPRYFQI